LGGGGGGGLVHAIKDRDGSYEGTNLPRNTELSGGGQLRERRAEGSSQKSNYPVKGPTRSSIKAIVGAHGTSLERGGDRRAQAIRASRILVCQLSEHCPKAVHPNGAHI